MTEDANEMGNSTNFFNSSGMSAQTKTRSISFGTYKTLLPHPSFSWTTHSPVSAPTTCHA